jgi:hypothetical protein
VTERTFCTNFEKVQGELASAEEADRLRAQDQGFATKLDGFNLATVMQSSDPQSLPIRLTHTPTRDRLCMKRIVSHGRSRPQRPAISAIAS